MAAKVSDRVRQLAAKAAELPAEELLELAEAIDSLLLSDETGAARHAVIAERIARPCGGAASLRPVESRTEKKASDGITVAEP